MSTDQYQWGGISVFVTNYKGCIGDTHMGGAWTGSPDRHNTTGNTGLFYRNSYQEPHRMTGITDGTSNTFLIGEDLPEHNWHSAAYYANGDYASCHAPLNYKPNPLQSSNWPLVMSFRSNHPGGAHFAMADASVRFVRDSVSIPAYQAASTRAGGETLQLDN